MPNLMLSLTETKGAPVMFVAELSTVGIWLVSVAVTDLSKVDTGLPRHLASLSTYSSVE